MANNIIKRRILLALCALAAAFSLRTASVGAADEGRALGRTSRVLLFRNLFPGDPAHMEQVFGSGQGMKIRESAWRRPGWRIAGWNRRSCGQRIECPPRLLVDGSWLRRFGRREILYAVWKKFPERESGAASASRKRALSWHPDGEQTKPPSLEKEYMGRTTGASQDGAVFNGRLFVMSTGGCCRIYEYPSLRYVDCFRFDARGLIEAHPNSVCFGTRYYRESDPYPLLYCNVYNRYKNEEDRREGICLAVRITEEDGRFSGRLVQIIRIGFTEDLTLWKSLPENGDLRPWGNFVVNPEKNSLIAFVPRDKERVMRYFVFHLPKPETGREIRRDLYEVVLEPEDIVRTFDSDYLDIIQGVCCHNRKLYILFGTAKTGHPASLAIVNIYKFTTRVIKLSRLKLYYEPEMIDVIDGRFVCGFVNGRTWELKPNFKI